MTNATTPAEAMFEMQRQSISQGQQLFQQGLDLQRNAARTFLQNGLSAQRSAQHQGTEMIRKLFNAQLDAVESAFDEGEFRSTMDRQFEQNTELTQQLVNAQFEQGAELLQQLFNAQLDAVESAFDEGEFRSVFNDQLSEFESTQVEAWDDLETEFVDAFDDLSDQQQRLVAQSVNAFLDARQDAEEVTIQGIEQTQEAAETAQQQAEGATEAAADASEEAIETAEESAEDAADGAESAADDAEDADLEAIGGLGETYANRLRDSGIESIEQLAQAETEAVAETADVAEERANEWVTTARSQA